MPVSPRAVCLNDMHNNINGYLQKLPLPIPYMLEHGLAMCRKPQSQPQMLYHYHAYKCSIVIQALYMKVHQSESPSCLRGRLCPWMTCTVATHFPYVVL